MSAPRLRETLASLHGERRGAPASLTHEAERAIHRTVARRWGLAAVAVTAAGALVVAGGTALVSALSAADAASSVEASPTVTDSPVPGIAHIPLAGGSEFNSLNDYPICGATAPQPEPHARGFSIAIAASVGLSGDPGPRQGLKLLTASVSYDAGDPGPSSRGPLWVLLVADGEVAGAAQIDAAQLHETVTREVGFPVLGVPAYSDMFACRKLSLRGPREYDLFPVEPGDYTAVAYTRIFATVESVVLSQALPGRYQLDEDVKQPGGVYRPGSYDCRVLESFKQMVRACLPDIVTGAQVDPDRQIVSVMFDAKELVAPFDVTLVSQPIDVTLASQADERGQNGSVTFYSGDTIRFASATDVVCGAVVNDYSAFEATGESRFDTDSGRDDVSIDAQVPPLVNSSAGTVQALVMPWLAPDRSSVRLDAGARVVYLLRRAPTTDLGWDDFEVVGFAPVEMLGVIPYDRYLGPTDVQLRFGEPERCVGITDDDALLATDTAVLGTWAVTPPDGPQTKHELISTTNAWLPSRGSELRGG